MYSCIGHTYFKVPTDIVVGDPGVCELHDILFSFPEINKRNIIIEHLSDGGYFSYHFGTGLYVFAEELLFLKDTYSIEDISSLVYNYVGNVCTAFTSSIFICDKTKAFNAKYCYYVLEADALYSCKDIVNVLSSMSSLSESDKCLLELCNTHNNIYLTGQQILDITGLSAIPEFLRDILSTHWTTEISNSLNERPAVSIVGGVVSNSGAGLLRVYTILDKNDIVGIRILLEPEE